MDISNKINALSKTKEINHLSNYVARAILYGGNREKDYLASAIENHLKPFAKEWLRGDMNAQEIVYMKAMSLLLKEGITAAGEAVTFRGDDLVRPELGE